MRSLSAPRSSGPNAKLNQKQRERLVQARQSAGLNQAQLAALIRKTRGAVSQFEKDGPGPSLRTLRRIARVCRTHPTYILTGE